MMEIVDWCLKVEKIVRLKDGKCNHDVEHGCPYRGTPLCLLKSPWKYVSRLKIGTMERRNADGGS